MQNRYTYKVKINKCVWSKKNCEGVFTQIWVTKTEWNPILQLAWLIIVGVVVLEVVVLVDSVVIVDVLVELVVIVGVVGVVALLTVTVDCMTRLTDWLETFPQLSGKEITQCQFFNIGQVV